MHTVDLPVHQFNKKAISPLSFAQIFAFNFRIQILLLWIMSARRLANKRSRLHLLMDLSRVSEEKRKYYLTRIIIYIYTCLKITSLTLPF